MGGVKRGRAGIRRGVDSIGEEVDRPLPSNDVYPGENMAEGDGKQEGDR